MVLSVTISKTPMRRVVKLEASSRLLPSCVRRPWQMLQVSMNSAFESNPDDAECPLCFDIVLEKSGRSMSESGFGLFFAYRYIMVFNDTVYVISNNILVL